MSDPDYTEQHPVNAVSGSRLSPFGVNILPLHRTKRSWTRSSPETLLFKSRKKRTAVVNVNHGIRLWWSQCRINNAHTPQVRSLREPPQTCRKSQTPSINWPKVRHPTVPSRNDSQCLMNAFAIPFVAAGKKTFSTLFSKVKAKIQELDQPR